LRQKEVIRVRSTGPADLFECWRAATGSRGAVRDIELSHYGSFVVSEAGHASSLTPSFVGRKRSAIAPNEE
jgi:hypothetical protein